MGVVVTGSGLETELRAPGPARARELERVRRHLADPTVRVVTLSGPAGVGKTWVARRVRTEDVRTDRGGLELKVVTVPIAAARSYDDLLVSIAEAVRLPGGDSGLMERLAVVFALEPHLLVVDACDRLEGEPHPIAALLDAVPSVRVVATALGPLHLEQERVVGLDPLHVPPPTAAPAALRESAAVQLFLQRAQQVSHDFDPATAELEVVGELCRRAHGLPLGIEILATRVGVESPSDTLAFLDSGQEITLEHTTARSDRHHLSLRGALDWSYRNLSTPAQQLLRRMAVFAGPATVDMLEVVARLQDGLCRPSYSEVLDTLSDLVDRRLVEPRGGVGDPGFVLVDLVRDLALEKLVAAGERGWAEAAHTQAVIVHAVSHGARIAAARDGAAPAELARTEGDLRAVLSRLVGSADIREGLLLATALSPFVLQRGYDGFVRSALASLLLRAGEGDVEDDLLARATMWRARLAAQFEGPSAAEEIRQDLDKCLPLARRGGVPQTVLLGLSFVMQALPVTGDFAGAAAAAEEGLPLAIGSGDQEWAARFCGWVGMVANQTGQPEQALALAERGLDYVEACGDPRAQVLLALLLSGLPSERAVVLRRRLPSPDELIETCDLLEPRYKPHVVRMAAGLALLAGDNETAARRCAEALTLARRQAAWPDLPFAVAILGLVAAARGDLRDAARLHGMVSGQLEAMRPGMPPSFYARYVETMQHVRAELGEQLFVALEARGAEGLRGDALTWSVSYAAAAAGRTGGREGARVVGATVPAQRGTGSGAGLTVREREVLVELVTGATNRQISERLGMAPKTVMHHSVSIYRKLDVRGRAEATAWAFRNGLVS